MDSNIIVAISSLTSALIAIVASVLSILKNYPIYRKHYKIKEKDEQSKSKLLLYKDIIFAYSNILFSIFNKFWKRTVLILVGGLILGSIAISIRPYSNFAGFQLEIISAIAVMPICSLLISSFHRKSGSLRWFHAENLLLWAGFISGWSFLHLGFYLYSLKFFLILWFLWSIIGSIIIIKFPIKGKDTDAT